MPKANLAMCGNTTTADRWRSRCTAGAKVNRWEWWLTVLQTCALTGAAVGCAHTDTRMLRHDKFASRQTCLSNSFCLHIYRRTV